MVASLGIRKASMPHRSVVRLCSGHSRLSSEHHDHAQHKWENGSLDIVVAVGRSKLSKKSLVILCLLVPSVVVRQLSRADKFPLGDVAVCCCE